MPLNRVFPTRYNSGVALVLSLVPNIYIILLRSNHCHAQRIELGCICINISANTQKEAAQGRETSFPTRANSA